MIVRSAGNRSERADLPVQLRERGFGGDRDLLPRDVDHRAEIARAGTSTSLKGERGHLAIVAAVPPVSSPATSWASS